MCPAQFSGFPWSWPWGGAPPGPPLISEYATKSTQGHSEEAQVGPEDGQCWETSGGQAKSDGEGLSLSVFSLWVLRLRHRVLLRNL